MNLEEKIQHYIIMTLIALIVSILAMRYLPQQDYTLDLSSYIRIADYEFLLDTGTQMTEEERTQLYRLYENEVTRIAELGYLVLDGRNIHTAPEHLLIKLPSKESAK